MTKNQNLQKALFHNIASKLVPHGFSEADTQTVTKPFSLGRQAIHLAFIGGSTEFDVTVDVAVRFDATEEILNKRNIHLSAREKKETFTLGAELGRIEGGGQLRWEVSDYNGIEPVAQAMYQKILAVALPYLERFSDPAQALAALSGDTRESWLHSPIHALRARRALVLAFLTKNRTELVGLARSKAEFLRQRNDDGLRDFEEFAKSLIEQASSGLSEHTRS